MHMSESFPHMQDTAAGERPARPRGRDGMDAVNKRIPPDATASDGIQGVEVAGIEPGGWDVYVVGRGADQR